MDNFEGDNQILIFTLFILATFLTQVTVLNMLIAIMGNTFDSVKESEAKSEAEMKIQILSDYISNIKSVDSTNKKNFIVLVTLDEEDDESGGWDGSVNMIKASIKKTKEEILGDVKQMNNSMMDLIQKQVNQEKKASATLIKRIKEIESKSQKTQEMVQKLEEKFD